MTPEPSAPVTADSEADPIEAARQALTVWSDPDKQALVQQYQRGAATVARTAAEHLSNVLQALDAERQRRSDAERRVAALECAIRQLRQIDEGWIPTGCDDEASPDAKGA